MLVRSLLLGSWAAMVRLYARLAIYDTTANKLAALPRVVADSINETSLKSCDRYYNSD